MVMICTIAKFAECNDYYVCATIGVTKIAQNIREISKYDTMYSNPLNNDHLYLAICVFISSGLYSLEINHFNASNSCSICNHLDKNAFKL